MGKYDLAHAKVLAKAVSLRKGSESTKQDMKNRFASDRANHQETLVSNHGSPPQVYEFDVDQFSGFSREKCGHPRPDSARRFFLPVDSLPQSNYRPTPNPGRRWEILEANPIEFECIPQGLTVFAPLFTILNSQ